MQVWEPRVHVLQPRVHVGELRVQVSALRVHVAEPRVRMIGLQSSVETDEPRAGARGQFAVSARRCW